MSNYNSLKATIDANIKQNGKQEITGQILNSVLNQMVTTLGAGYQFAGVATIDTNPGTPDAKVFYIANGKGTYEKFGGINVTEDEVVILYWDSAWHKVATGIASQAKLSELEGEIRNVTGYEVAKDNVANWGWVNDIPLKIPVGSFVNNNGIQVALYTAKTEGTTIVIKHGQTVKTTAEYNFVRAWQETGDVNICVGGYKESIEEHVHDNYVPFSYNSFVIGRINNKVEEYFAGYHRTLVLPIISGYGYQISGVSSVVCSYFKNTDITDASNCILQTTAVNHQVPTDAKYVVYDFNDNTLLGDLDDVLINPLVEIQKTIQCSPFEMIKTSSWDTVRLNKLLAVVKNSIKWLYFNGENITITDEYRIQILKSGLTIRFIIYKDTVSVFDGSATQEADKVLDAEIKNNGYSLKVVADLRHTEDITDITSPIFQLSKNAFNAVIPSVTKEGSKDEGSSFETGEHEEDYSKYFEYSEGGQNGYVLSTTGVFGNDSAKRVTDYIPTIDLKYVKAYTPKGSGAGLAFYDKDKIALTNYQGRGKAGYSAADGATSNYGVWKEVPNDAAYVRVTCDYSVNHELYVIKKDYSDKDVLLETFASIPKSRTTKVIWGWEDFNGMQTSRVQLTQSTYNEDARQITAKYEHYINRTSLEVSFTATSNDCFIGVGCEFAIFSEVRVSGNTFSIRCGSSAQDTYAHIDPTVVFSDILPFTITNGKTYKLGYKKRDASKVGDEYVDNAVFYIDDCEGNRYEKTIERTASASDYNGVAGRYSALLLGRPFVSLKQGSVIVNNIVFSSDYSPRVKCLLAGDSFVAGDTMTNEGQRYKYAALLQQSVGLDDFVIVGKGGEELSESWILQISESIRKFYPEYVVISLGTNNQILSIYKELLQLFTGWLKKIGIKPILVTITPYRYGSNNDYRKEFRMAANDYVRNSGIRYVDICSAVTTDADGSTWNPDYVKADGVHPSKAGHQAIYEAFVRELPEIFNV